MNQKQDKAGGIPMVVPEAARRKLAAEYRKLAQGRKYTPRERADFARMADSWQSTLPKE